LADEDDTEQYLQVDLGRQHPVYAISVRGNPLTMQFVTSYKVLFSTDGHTFAEATDQSGSSKVKI
jgi:F5/8 type C domain